VNELLSTGFDNTHRFDPVFYRAFYADIAHFSDEEALSHWKEHGAVEGRFANSGEALAHALQDESLPRDFDVHAYMEINSDVANSVTWPFQAVEHYKTYGSAELRRYSFWNHGTDAAALPFEVPQPSASEENFPVGFNIASYLAANPDVRQAYPSAKGALWHFLEMGRTEKQRVVAPTRMDRHFIRQFYDITVPEEITLVTLAEFMRLQLKCGIEYPIYCDAIELLLCHGISSDIIASSFDENYYRTRFISGSNANRSRALHHFVTDGQFMGHDISYDSRFDSIFYSLEYDENQTLEDMTTKVAGVHPLYRHWLEVGSATGCHPNLTMLCQAWYKLNLPAHITRTLMKLASKTLSKPSDLLRRVIEDAELDLFAAKPLAAADTGFVLDLAERFAGLNQFNKSDQLISIVLKQYPEHARGHRQHANNLYTHGFWGSAMTLWEEELEARTIGELSVLRLAECHEQLGDASRAAQVACDWMDLFPGSAYAQHRGTQFLAKNFLNSWDKGPERALGNSYEAGLKSLNDSLACFPARQSRYQRPRSIRNVALLSNDDLQQCYLYRVEQKLEQLEEAGFKAHHFEYGQQSRELVGRIWDMDLVIAYRLPAFPEIIDTLGKIRNFGVPIIYDIDDLIFDSELFPPSLESYDGQITQWQHAQLALSTPLYRKAMEMADYAMASTTSLLEHMKPHVSTGQGFVHPNGMGYAHVRAMKSLSERESNSGPCTIFYGSGTKAHKAAFKEILVPALVRIARKHGENIRIVVIGHFGEMDMIPEDLQHLFSVRQPGGLWAYWNELNTADINLAVLEEGPVVDAKSEIKWLEAAMLAIPSIVSPTATFVEVLDDGETGFLAGDEEAFFTHLDRLVSAPDLRKQVGEKARQVALDRYGPQRMAERMGAVIRQIEATLPKRRKQLLIGNVFFAPQSIGGATRVVEDNVREIRQIVGDEWEITILATKEGGETPYEIDWHVVDGVRVFTITAPIAQDIDSRSVDKAMIDPISRCLDEIQPDLVHMHCIQRLTTSFADVVRRRDTPYIITMHDGWWISPNQFIIGNDGQESLYDMGGVYERNDPLRGGIYDRQRVLEGAAAILTVSESFAAVCRRAGVTHVKAVDNGVSKIPQVQRVPNESGKVRLGHFGGLELHKGIPYVRSILQAHRFENLSLLLLDHAMAASDVRWEEWNGTWVEIRGRMPQSEIWSLYARTDVFLAPSLWPESYGLVSREALACGCWVLASDRGAIGEPVVDGQNGFIVDMNDDAALLAALKEIDTNPSRYMQSPLPPSLRTSKEQAADLVEIYRSFIDA